MSDMYEWAKEEVRLACLHENPTMAFDENGMPETFDYGCACFASALKAYKTLLDDGHSGFSFPLTVDILNLLCKNIPLSPIEDIPEVWNEVPYSGKNGEKLYQCKRRHSLFKTVKDDGTVVYNDFGRVVAHEVDEHVHFTSGFITDLIEEMYPIVVPYIVDTEPYDVSVHEFLVDPKNGDFDTVGVIEVKTPSGEIVPINRYFKVSDKWYVEISEKEYKKREKNKVKWLA